MHLDRQLSLVFKFGLKPKLLYLSLTPDVHMANIYVYEAVAIAAVVLPNR